MPLGSGSILLVEDNRADVLVVEEAMSLQAIQRDLIVATDGEKALEIVAKLDQDTESLCPALIIMDLNLPRRNGFEVMTALRESARCALIPVVVLSSSRADNDKKKAMTLGAKMYLEKPTSYAEVLSLGATLNCFLAEFESEPT